MTEYNYEVRFTRNMGNYESLQLHEGLTDAKRDNETVDQLRARVMAKVDKWLLEDVERVERDIRGLRKDLDEEAKK